MSADQSQNLFELFGLPAVFELDRADLDQRYRKLQSTVHPDRFASASDQERRLSVQQAANINEGYRVLKDPLQRGRYLLELRGYSFKDEHHTTSDPAFLMEQMELRETLGELRGAEDPLAAVAELQDQIGRRYDELVTELATTLSSDEHSLEQGADQVLKLQFFRKLQDEAAALEADLEDELI